MIGLDTNVLVRYLAGDPKSELQVIQSVERVDRALEEEEPIFLNQIVICETVWVLLFRYKVPKRKLIESLECLFLHPGFVFENRGLLIRALELFRERKVDFADTLIALVNSQQGCRTTYSFDKQAIRQLEFKGLPEA